MNRSLFIRIFGICAAVCAVQICVVVYSREGCLRTGNVLLSSLLEPKSAKQPFKFLEYPEPKSAKQPFKFLEVYHHFSPEGSTSEDLYDGLSTSDLSKHGLEVTGTLPLRSFIDLEDTEAVGMQNRPQTIEDMSYTQIDARFRQLAMRVHLKCKDVKVIGEHPGDYDICMSSVFKPQQNGIVYSFGINNDFSFDDTMFKDYKCFVKSYDPSMKQKDYKRSEGVYFYQMGLGGADELDGVGWKMLSYPSILKKNGHENTVIEILKFDIEHSDKEALRTMLVSGALRDVKQLAFEFHIFSGLWAERQYYLDWYGMLLELERQGFRKFSAKPWTTDRTKLNMRLNKNVDSAYILLYINLRFLKV